MHVGTARPDRCGVTTKLCLWDGLWDWAEGLINRSCEAGVIYIISLTWPEINDSLLYMSFITLNLLLLFSSLKLYAHTHAQTHQVHETSYYVVNMCNYDGGRVGQIERDRDGRTQSLHESTVGGSHMGHIFKWAEPAQSIKLNVSVSTESVCYHQDECTDHWGQLTTPKLPSKNPVLNLLCSVSLSSNLFSFMSSPLVYIFR